jgi:short-subunit dehydrogenase
MNIKEKVFVVTGAGNGVGQELVMQLLVRGARVACVDIDPRALEETVRLSGAYRDRLSVHAVDVTDREAVESLPEQVIAAHGAVDAVINNAGIIQPFGNVEETGYDAARKVMSVNFYGTLHMVMAFLPYLTARPTAHIINISSAGALSPMPGETLYGASKAAVKIMTEGLRYELQSTNVRVMVVFPGGINTDIIHNSGVPVGQSIDQLRDRLSFLLLTPEKTAKIILRGIERNRSRLAPGIDASVADFFSRVSPRLAPRLIYRFIDAVLSPRVRPQKSGAEEHA